MPHLQEDGTEDFHLQHCQLIGYKKSDHFTVWESTMGAREEEKALYNKTCAPILGSTTECRGLHHKLQKILLQESSVISDNALTIKAADQELQAILKHKPTWRDSR